MTLHQRNFTRQFINIFYYHNFAIFNQKINLSSKAILKSIIKFHFFFHYVKLEYEKDNFQNLLFINY